MPRHYQRVPGLLHRLGCINGLVTLPLPLALSDFMKLASRFFPSFISLARARRQKMTSSASILLWTLVVACLAVVLPAAAARELSGSPAASPQATTATSQLQGTLQWLQITAVPLGVFLIGACTWSYIKNFVVWRSVTGRREDVSDAPGTSEGDQVLTAERPNDSSHDRDSDLEEGIALTQLRLDDSQAMSAQTPPDDATASGLQSPSDAGNRATVAVTSQL